jgi:hypothetical protein
MTDLEPQILSYLRSKVSEGHSFFKSKYIAKDTGLSAKQVGTTLLKLSKKQDITNLEIKQWSCSLSTTWRITRL